MASLMTRLVFGMSRLFAEINHEYLSGLLPSYAEINFLHFAIFLFIICSAVLIIVSLVTQPPLDEKVAGLTYATATKTESDPVWRRKDVLLLIILAIVVGLVWVYFTG